MKHSCLILAAIIAFASLQVQAKAQNLGTAESFAVLGGSTVTNTGSSVVKGDLGVWPGLAITGFPPGIVVPPGTEHPGDAVAQQAQSDLTIVYNALAGMACNTDLTGQDLGGLTLTPGVYCFSTSAQLTGKLTLNAQGNGDALFVFQIGSTITTASNSSVLLTNGGQACNVLWQVGSSATLGTDTAFAGNILALTSITVTTGADVSGRALARNGAVTMDTNNISISCVPCLSATDCPTEAPLCNAITGLCVFCITDGNCDDGLFCNGVETCDITGGCQPGAIPCPPLVCNEDTNSCDSCESDGDCDDGNECTSDQCNSDTDECENPCTDTIDPTPVGGCPPMAVNVQCASDIPVFAANFTDNCDTELLKTPGGSVRDRTCPNRYVLDRSVVATDDCNNTARCDQTVTVFDDTPPTIRCSPTLVLTCQVPEGVPIDSAAIALMAEDNCGSVTITDDRPEAFYPPTCGRRAPTRVTFTATDDCGNDTTCEVDVEVVGPMCCPGIADGNLTLMPVSVDLRQDTNGPVNTKAKFDIWNQNEVRFSGTERCISCWDQTAFSLYNSPNQLLMSNLHTDKGRARIDGLASTVCPASVASPLLGVALRAIRFEGGAGQRDEVFRSAIPLPGTGSQSARILYDVISPPDDAMALAGVGGLQIQPAGRTAAGLVAGDRGSISTKGSVFALPLVQVRWDAAGQLIEDTFVSVTNDGAAGVSVQFYFVQGDGPLDAVYVGDPARLLERAHEGWNNVDNNFVLTANQTVYWSAFTGAPTGVSPWTVLDPGDSPGRMDMDPGNRGGRVIRGFILGWAVDAEGREIHWNHLTANAMLIHYRDTSAAEYEGWAFGCVSGAVAGAWCDSSPGVLNLDGVEYASAPDKLLMDFYTVGSEALSHPAARP